MKNNILNNEIKDNMNLVIKYLTTKNSNIAININSNNTTINNNIINNYDPSMIDDEILKKLIENECEFVNSFKYNIQT